MVFVLSDIDFFLVVRETPGTRLIGMIKNNKNKVRSKEMEVKKIGSKKSLEIKPKIGKLKKVGGKK